MEPLEAHKEGESKYCAVPGYIFLKPGSHRIHVMVKNLTTLSITVNQGSKTTKMAAVNAVPHMLPPQTPPQAQIKTIPAKSTQRSTINGDTQWSDILDPH